MPVRRSLGFFAASVLLMLLAQGALPAHGAAEAAACKATDTRAYVDVANRDGTFIEVFCGSKTTWTERIRLPRRPTAAIDHDAQGFVYSLQEEPADGNDGNLFKIQDGKIVAGALAPDRPRAMAVDRKRGEIYVVRASREGDYAWKPELSVYDAATLKLKRSYKAGDFSGRWLLAVDGRSNAIVEPMDAYPAYIAVIDGSGGEVLHKLSAGCAIQPAPRALYVVDCLGNLIRYNPSTYAEEGRENRSRSTITAGLNAGTAVVGTRGRLYVANSSTNQLLMYSSGERTPFLSIDSIPVESMALDRSGALYVLVGEPQLANVKTRLDVYDGDTGALRQTYTFDRDTYPFAMTVVSP